MKFKGHQQTASSCPHLLVIDTPVWQAPETTTAAPTCSGISIVVVLLQMLANASPTRSSGIIPQTWRSHRGSYLVLRN